jgi:hypothetical protein
MHVALEENRHGWFMGKTLEEDLRDFGSSAESVAK